MNLPIKAKIHRETKEGTVFTVLVPNESLTDVVKKFSPNGVLKGELRIDDSRVITAEQRKKAYATIADIANYSYDEPERIKEIMKYYYISSTGEQYFSLSDCSVATARQFISYMLDFALLWGIPLAERLIDRTDDINAAIYSSLKHKRCIICGAVGEIQNWDSNLRKLCLCRIHHTEAQQTGREAFEQKYHVYGIIFKE